LHLEIEPATPAVYLPKEATLPTQGELTDQPRAFAGRASNRGVPNKVVNVILQLGPAHFEFFDFLVGGEIDLLFNAIDFVIEPMVLIEHAPEMVTRTFKSANDVAMFRELSQDWMMEVHGTILLFWW
jgi:hypothetical protein